MESSDRFWEFTKALVLGLILCVFSACGGPSTRDGNGSGADDEGDVYIIGAGIHDITGPAAGIGMMGYSLPEQRTQGIHMRLRSRAFIIGEPADGKRVVLVIADLGQVFQAVKQEVIRVLREDPELGLFYDEKNVLISATHTHSGPGGYSHYDLYNLSLFGFVEQNFTAITSGIVESIRKAHGNIVPGRILIKEGRLEACGWNASRVAYDRNPAEERASHEGDTDRIMKLLKLVSVEGEEIGMVNWFPVHPTNLGNTIRLISGDNKGLAAYLFEKDKGADYASADTFVAAFAQANAGDVSPSLFWGYPDGIHDFERMEILARRQVDKALELYDAAHQPLRGGVDYRHMYADFSHVLLDPEWIQDGDDPVDTCTAAIGISMLAGSTEDSVGLPFIPEGITCGSDTRPCIPLVPEDQPCHKEKYVFLSLGRRSPVPWTPEVLPVQILKIGGLAVIGHPTEITTMAGRRLRHTVLYDLAGTDVDHVVIAGLSNAYAGYVTTREEYSAQHYEGASTHFGPYTLNAFQQTFSLVARAMADQEDLPSGPSPRDLSSQQNEAPFSSVLFDSTPKGVSFGDVHQQPSSSYERGETVTVVFWGGDPKNDLRTQDSYLFVEKERIPNSLTARSSVTDEVPRGCGAEGPLNWTPVFHDWDPETRFIWEREGIAASRVTINWAIPQDTEPGEYRIRHAGSWKSFLTGETTPYSGTTNVFHVR